jgi:hypothetical protein
MHWINPESLPEITGTFERFILNPHGEVDGFIMNGEAAAAILVHTPPHMDGELTRHISHGEIVRVRGVRPRKAALVAAVAVTTATGHRIVDEGPDHDRKHPKLKREPMSAESTVRMSLFGPKGELRGALLADGTILRIGPKEAEQVAALLAPGSKVATRGDGIATEHGRVIDVLEIGTDPRGLKPVRKPKPKDHPKDHHKDDPKHRVKPDAKAA